MNTPLIKKFLPRFLFVGALTITLVPLLTYAADFVPLAPIPNLDTSENATIGSYVNSVFLLVISVAAMLAVIRIVIGGFQYMTQTASVTKTASAVSTIRDAVIGLLLLLGSFVILSTVNKEIVNLEALNFSRLGASPATQKAIDDAKKESDERQARNTSFSTGEQYLGNSNSRVPQTLYGSTLSKEGLSSADISGLKSACKKAGRTYKETQKNLTCYYSKGPAGI